MMCIDHVPRTIQGMDAYVQDGGSAWERLARTWECEIAMSRRGGQAIGKPTTDRWWREFWTMWANQHETQDEPDPEF